MPHTALLQSLLTAGRTGDFDSIAGLPGAGVHQQVCNFSQSLCGYGGTPLLDEIASWPTQDRAAFAKALAVYESSVGGLASVTALEYVLGLFQSEVQEGLEVMDWILSHTKALLYYGYRAHDFIDPGQRERRREWERVENEKRNYELAAPARARRAERATSNLFNAIRRGDTKAVEALLRQGAAPQGVTPDGIPLVRYAEQNNRTAIAQLLRQAQGGTNAA